MRTKLMDRQMPVYSKGEEIFNMVSHIVGGGLGVAGMVLCIVISVIHHNTAGIIGSIIYGLTIITLYTMSSIYHGLLDGKGKRVMQVMDHCTIFPLIAGTYTPILVSAIRPRDPVACWVLLAIVWIMAIIGIVFNAIDLKNYRTFSMIAYLSMGWCVVFRIRLLIECVGWGGFWLILAGGILYTIGAVLYGKGKTKKWMHSVFHVFCVLGTTTQMLAIMLYVL